MILLRNILIVVIVWALLGATNALAKAHDHEDHSHHQGHMVSPFEAKKEAPSLHCLLRSHNHQGFCPHSNPGKNQNTPISIAADCGGKTSGALPGTSSFQNDFAQAIFIPLKLGSSNTLLISSKFSSFSRFIDALDPPPRVI